MPNEFSSNALTRRGRSRDELTPQVVPQRGGLMRPPVSQAAAANDSELFNPKLLLRGLWQHLMAALALGTVVGAAGAAAAWVLVPAPYEAKALIQVKPEAPKLLFTTGDNLRYDPHYIKNQTQLIVSDIVVRKAMAKPGIADVDLFKAVDHPRNYLRRNLRAVIISPEIMELRLSGEDPRGLALVVNAVQEAYFDEIVNVDRHTRVARLDELSRILEEKEEEIRSKRTTMKQMSDVVGSIDPEANAVLIENTLNMMSQMRQKWMDRRFELMREQILLKAMLDDPKSKNRQLPEGLINSMISSEPEVEKLEDQLSQKQQLLTETERVTKKDHPALEEIRNQIANLNRSLSEQRNRVRPRIEQKLKEELSARSDVTIQDRRFRVELLQSEEKAFRDEFELLQKEAKRLGATSFDLEDKKEEIASLEKVSRVLNDEINAVKVELSAHQRVQLLQAAEPPIQRDKKKRVLATVGAGAGGLALVCFLIALAEARLRRVMSVDDVAHKLRVMGQVPLIPTWVSHSSRAAKSKKGRFWHDMLTESVDAARTLLVHDAEQEDLRVIMVVSAMPSEGKTTLSCHIASSLARAGRKVVLVDCDFRRPNVNRVFNLSNKTGFCEVLLGKVDIDEAIQPGVPGGPAILAAGQFTPSVSPLLGMEATEQVFRQLRERFEFVIVDTSPVMIVHDTLVVAQHVDAAMIAVRKSVSRQPKVMAVVDRLQALEVPVLGTVAIGLESDSHDYGSSYYQGYSKYYTSKRHRQAK